MRVRVALLSLFLWVGVLPFARSAPISTGVEQLLWPAIILIGPIEIVHELIFDSDSKAAKAARKQASAVLEKITQPIPAGGIYMNSLNLELALQGLLAQSKIPVVEVDVPGSYWFLSKGRSQQDLIERSAGRKYIRISLGMKGDADCFVWKSDYDDFLQRVPIRPGTCLLVSFTNELQSDLEIRVDSSRVANGELRWELLDRINDRVLLAVPFWQSQTKGEALIVTPIYQDGSTMNTFAEIIQKLSPSIDVKRKDGLPFRLKWTKQWSDSPASISQFPASVVGHFRQISLPWSSIPLVHQNETWSDGYARAAATGRNIIMNNMLLIIPNADAIAPACAFPRDCDFSSNFTSEIGVLSLRYDSAYQSASLPTSAHEMSINVAIRSYSGRLTHFAKVVPEEVPASASLCKDWSLGCYFYPRQATTTERELVVRGAFGVRDNLREQLPKEEYELAVPLSELPAPRYQ